ncbi:hypothetical protein PC128_g22264 [Phytophthora cactorum]|nr:hypothetical protein PC128_g22264 [Phytophthora cactorum]
MSDKSPTEIRLQLGPVRVLHLTSGSGSSGQSTFADLLKREGLEDRLPFTNSTPVPETLPSRDPKHPE